MNRIMKKLVPGVLAAALALGAVPSGITFDDIKASADVPTTRKVVALGGSIGTQVNAKLIFHVDDSDTSVAAIKVQDPDNEAWVTYEKKDWNSYGTTTGDYIVTVPVYPKNMGEKITFKMLDASKKEIEFYAGHSYTDSEYTFTVDNYLESIQGEIDNNKTGKNRDIKDNATDLEKATWDLCNALMNYGDWADAYLKHKGDVNSQPQDGRYVSYNFPDDAHSEDEDGYHPKYPSWWTDTTYWKSETGVADDQDFNDMLSNKGLVATVAYQYGGNTDFVNGQNDSERAYKTVHPYTIALVLDDMVKIRVRFGGTNTAVARVGVGSENYDRTLQLHAVFTGDTHQKKDLYSCYVDSDPINFNQLSTNHYFEFTGVCPSEAFNRPDKVCISVVTFAKIVNDKRVNDHAFEQNGLANTMRALVTVSAAQHNYEEALKSSTPPAE